jgi:hypothetical protein
MPPMILLPLRVEIEVDLPTPSRAKDVLQNMGLSPPIPPPNGEWTAPHDHRRVAAELLVANHALEWMRVLLARGLLLAGTGGPADDGWLQWTADGRFELKRDWVSALLHPGSSGTPGQGLSPEQEDLVAIEVFRIGLSSPTTVVGGFWSNFWKWLERAAAVGELGHLGHLAFRQQAAAALFALGLGVPTPATPPPPPVRPEPIVLVAPQNSTCTSGRIRSASVSLRGTQGVGLERPLIQIHTLPPPGVRRRRGCPKGARHVYVPAANGNDQPPA